MELTAFPVVRALADLLCPERCASCATTVRAETLFCHACRAAVNVLGPPECACCGAPCRDAGPRCGTCEARAITSPVRTARAWAAYESTGERRPVAETLAAFKYGGAHRLARRLAAAMAARVTDLSVEVVAPIPLHPRRLRSRGYNQSVLLARHLARIVARPLAVDLLRRTRDTPSQTALSAAARARNVAGAFAVARPACVRDAAILLVDDVWTSGATALAAAAVLRDAGARAVDVVTFARVP
jgi:ComF family protein